MPKLVDQVALRLAQPEDVATIAGLLTQTFYSQSGWRSLFSPIFKMGLCYDISARLQIPNLDKYQCWIAEVPQAHPTEFKEIVGTVEVSLRSLSLTNLFLPTQAYISNLAVKETYRRQGIGKTLVAKCEKAAQSWKQSNIFLHVRSENTTALSLYQQLGYDVSPQQSALDTSRQLMSKII